MMRSFYALLLVGYFCIGPVFVWGQATADSLELKRLLEESNELINKQQFDLVLIKLDTAKQICSSIFGSSTIQFAEVLNLEGYAYYNKQLIDQSIELYAQSIRLRETLLSPDHPELAVSYQNLGNSLAIKGETDMAIGYLIKALGIKNKSQRSKPVDIAKIYTSLGNCFRNKSEFDQAISFHKKALTIFIEIFGQKHINIAKTYGNIANCYRGKCDLQRAIEYNQKGISSLNDSGSAEKIYLSLLLNQIAICLQEKGEYDKALEYTQSAYNIQVHISGPSNYNSINQLNQLGIIYQHLGELERAIECHEKVLNFTQQFYGESHPLCAIPLVNIGNSYNESKQYKKALHYFRLAEKLHRLQYGENDIRNVVIYLNLAISYQGLGDFDSSMYINKKCLDIYRKQAPNDKRTIVMIMNNIGHVLVLKGEVGSGIDTLKQSLKIQTAEPAIFNNLLSIDQFFLTNQKLGYAYYVMNKSNPSVIILKLSDQYYQDAITIFNKIRKSGYTIEAKSGFLRKYYGLFEGLIQTKNQLNYFEHSTSHIPQMFDLSESIKSIILNENIKEGYATGFSGISDDLLQQVYDLRNEITWREKQRQTLFDKGFNATDTSALFISSILFDLKRDYESLQQRLETQYPDYYRLKYDLRTVSLDYVQDTLLAPNQTLLEYFVGDSTVYAFVVRHDTFAIAEIPRGPGFPLDSLVRRLRHGLTDAYAQKPFSPSYLKTTADEYADAAFQLYQKLIAPIAPLLTEKVIVVPDGVLGYIPFDALLEEKPRVSTRFQNHAYLGKKKQISYAYSATLLREMRDKKHKKPATASLLVLAPFFRGNPDTLREHLDTLSEAIGLRRDTLTALPASGREVKAVAEIGSGKAWYGVQSTKDRFLREAGQYRVLHFGTHGQANDRLGDYAWLAFSDPADSLAFDKFFVKDIYNLSLNADLVTLSACETGIGELQRGEGIISLARAFAYAGAKSMVTTLWRISDAGSAELMTLFYQNLRAGMEKDAALWKAKRDFIDGHPSDGIAHPYFWAGFIPVGDMRVLSFEF